VTIINLPAIKYRQFLCFLDGRYLRMHAGALKYLLYFQQKQEILKRLNEKIPVDVSQQGLSGFDCLLGIVDTRAMGEHRS
jgi:hypothetical protein